MKTNRTREENFGGRAGKNSYTGGGRKNSYAGGSVKGPSNAVHNPIAEGRVGFQSHPPASTVGSIAGGHGTRPARPADAARRYGADGVCKPAKGYPGHRVGARGD